MFERRKAKKAKLAALDDRFAQCNKTLIKLDPASEEYEKVLAVQDRITDQRNKIDPPVNGNAKADFINSFGVIGSMMFWEKSNPVIGGVGDVIKKKLTQRK